MVIPIDAVAHMVSFHEISPLGGPFKAVRALEPSDRRRTHDAIAHSGQN